MKKHIIILFVTLSLSIQTFAQYGEYDTTLNSVGRIDFSISEAVVDVVTTPGGKTILLAYHVIAPYSMREMSLIRLNQNGSLDPTFGQNGIKIISSNISHKAIAMKLDSNNSIFILGNDISATSGSQQSVIKVDSNGNPVTSYGINGEAIFSYSGIHLELKDFDIDDDGGLFIIGEKSPTPQQSFVMHLLPDGSKDTCFGINGIIYPTSGYNYRFNDICVIDSNHILAVGDLYSAASAYMFMIDNHGNIDSNFANNGHKQFSIMNASSFCSYAVATSSNDIIIGGGFGVVTGGWILKMDTSGNIDSNYSAGNFLHQYRLNAMNEKLMAFSINENDEIIFAVRSQGPFSGSGAYTHAIMLTISKLLPNGLTDSSFGNNGVFQDSIINSSPLKTMPTSMFIGDDKKITVVGFNDWSSYYNPFVIRLDGRFNQQIITDSIINKTYGDSSFSINAVSTSGQTCSFSVLDTNYATNNNGSFSIKNAGNTTIIVSVLGNSNYTPCNTTIPLFINKKSLNIIASDTSRAINTPNPLFTLDYNGFVNGENISYLDSLPTTSTTASITSPIGTYPIIVQGGNDNNYLFNYTNGLLTVFNPTTINNSNADSNQLSIFPNPAKSMFFIDLKNEDKMLFIYDMNGKIVFETELKMTFDGQYKVIVESISSGLYHIVVSGNKGIRRTSLIIQ